MPRVNIVPVASGFNNRTLVAVNIYVASLELNVSVNLGVNIYDDQGNVCFREQLVLSGEAYTNWGNDDQYIVDYVLNHYNLTPLPEVPVEPVEPTVEPVEPTVEPTVEPVAPIIESPLQ